MDTEPLPHAPRGEASVVYLVQTPNMELLTLTRTTPLFSD